MSLMRNSTSVGLTPHPNAFMEVVSIPTSSNTACAATITDPGTGFVQIVFIFAAYDNGLKPTNMFVQQATATSITISPATGTGPFDIALSPFVGGLGTVTVVFPASSNRQGALSVGYQYTN